MAADNRVTPNQAELAQRIIDDLASEIDLHIEDEDLRAVRAEIENLQVLQRMIGRHSSDLLDHVVARLKSVDG